MEWREFADWRQAAKWVSDGNVAIYPGPIERRGGGVAMYIQTRDRATFVAACRELGAEPPDLPRDRCSINIDRILLLKAIVRAQHGALAVRYGDVAPWQTRCPTCTWPVDHVTIHESTQAGALLNRTEVACAAGHTWKV